MAFQLSPGVAVTERDLTTIVPTVAVTNAGMAGLIEWGPAEKIVIVSTVQELSAEFGLPRDGNYQWWFTAANYLGYGNNLRIVRTVADAATNASAKTSDASSGYVKLNDPEDAEMISSTNTGFEFIARYPGSLGNSLKIQVCGGGAAANDAVGFASWGLSGMFSGAPTSSVYAERNAIGGAAGCTDAFHMVVIDEEGKFSGATGTILEKYENLSVIPGAVSSDGTSLYYKTKLNGSSKYVAVLGAENPTVATMLGGFSTVSSNEDNGPWTINVTNSSYYTGGLYSGSFAGGGGDFGTADDITSGELGYNKLADPDTVDVNLLLGASLTGNNAQKLCDIAKARMDCVAFVSAENYDPTLSSDVKKSACTTIRNAVGNNNYAFIDSGYKLMYDPYNDRNRWVPLNGDIAGLCARTDATNDPWWSPAGFNRGQIRNVIKLAYNPTRTQRDEIYQKGINPVVTFPGEGTVLYGDKTAQTKPSAFDRINVRRLFIVLEKSIAVAAKYSLFEFNDSFTRAQFKSLVEPFLRDVQARRGIIDFKVVCSEANNTSQVIDSNRFVADIYVKPNRSINYIQLNFIATKSGVSFEEVGA